MLVCGYPEGWGLQEEYLRRIVGPLPIHKELVLMLSFRQIQDGYEVILAAEREEAVFQLGGLPLAPGPTEFGCRRADMFNNAWSESQPRKAT